MTEITCHKCMSPCLVEGDYTEWLTWCETCNSYPQGPDGLPFDQGEHMVNEAAGIADMMRDEIKESGNE